MLPHEFNASPSSKANRYLRTFRFIDIYLIHLIVFLSLFSFSITSTLLAIIKIIFGEKKGKPNFYTKPILLYVAKYAALVYIAFEIETSVNYLVSYFDDNKYNYEPLKDNFQTLMVYLLPWWNPMMADVTEYITLPGADSFAFTIILIIIIGCFARIKTKNANILIYTGIYCKIMAITRIIRVIAFSIVLMPNPKMNCYLEKFRVPERTSQMILDMLKFRNAGCNDLVISGHTLFIWVTLKLISDIIGKFTAYSCRVIVFIVLLNIIMIKNHYSVDVFLGIVVAEFVWDRVMAREKNTIDEYTKDNTVSEGSGNDENLTGVEIVESNGKV